MRSGDSEQSPDLPDTATPPARAGAPHGGWVASFRLRARAISYAVRLALSHPARDYRFDVAHVLIGIAAIVLAVGALTIVRDLLVISAVAILLLAVAALMLWRAGDLNRIMCTAARVDSRAARVRRDMEVGMLNHWIYALLVEMYATPLSEASATLRQAGHPTGYILPLQDNGTMYATAILPVGDPHLGDLDAVIGELSDIPDLPPLDHAECRQRLIARWRTIDRQEHMGDERGSNYVCRGIASIHNDKGGTIELSVAVASYGRIVRSCDSLINELALLGFLALAPTRTSWKDAWKARWTSGRDGRIALYPDTPRAPDVERSSLTVPPTLALRHLPLRRRVNANSTKVFTELSGRAAGLGASMVTVSSDMRAAIAVRSDVVGTYPRVLHVIPSGMCNAHDSSIVGRGLGGDARQPGYFESILKCEFVEEWYDDRELRHARRVLDWMGTTDAKWREHVESHTNIVFTGIAIDLMNLRPEVCAYVVTDNPQRDGTYNEEYDEDAPRTLILLPLDQVGRIVVTDIVQSGAGALALAQRSIAEREGRS